MLHFNELPFKALFYHHDGKTNSPKSSGGPIGRSICEIRTKATPASFVDFDPIPGPELKIDDELLVNEDQKYFYLICLLVMNGIGCLDNLGASFSKKLPGAISNARWLTTASSILYLYVTTKKPTKKLIRVVTYIINVYAPTFFRVKKDFLVQNGAIIYCETLVRARECLTDAEFKKVQKSFKTNSYMATSEYILLAGILDENPEIRQKSMELILKARDMHKDEVRKYELPKAYLKLDSATHYFDLLDFDELPVRFLTAPPLLQEYSDEDIIKAASKELELDLPKIPLHSQNCERAVAATTFASQKAIGIQNRHEFLLNLQANRDKITTQANKDEYF